MSSLRKIESKFRKLNMMYTHVKPSDLELRTSKSYISTLIVNKKPGQIGTNGELRGDSPKAKSNRTGLKPIPATLSASDL